MDTVMIYKIRAGVFLMALRKGRSIDSELVDEINSTLAAYGVDHRVSGECVEQ